MLLGGHIEINVFKYKQVLYLYLNVMLFTCSMKQKKIFWWVHQIDVKSQSFTIINCNIYHQFAILYGKNLNNH